MQGPEQSQQKTKLERKRHPSACSVCTSRLAGFSSLQDVKKCLMKESTRALPIGILHIGLVRPSRMKPEPLCRTAVSDSMQWSLHSLLACSTASLACSAAKTHCALFFTQSLPALLPLLHALPQRLNVQSPLSRYQSSSRSRMYRFR